jgi:SAM-dependent methyltransferase
LKKPSPLVSRRIVNLKEDFRKSRKPNSLICEAIPVCYSNRLPIENCILRRLHDFAKSNSIYFSSDNIILGGIPCRSYHGDINDHWLDSKKYDTNYQPFYPTWILSAYALSLEAKRLGFKEIVDVGSGDGRIAYCAKLLGMRSIGIEIDSGLVELQRQISKATEVKFEIINADASTFEYNSLDLSNPMFFISGLPESGEMLATTLISRFCKKAEPEIINRVGFNFMGSHVMKQFSRDTTKWGWGKVIEIFNLEVIECLTLPTYWTNDLPTDTAYVYTITKYSSS